MVLLLHLFFVGSFLLPRPGFSGSRHSLLSPRAAVSATAKEDLEPVHGRLVLVRHGQSEWNRANLFTGWVDVDLTEQGIAEAREAGKLLAAEDIAVDEVHTSYLRRAIRSAVLMLSTADQCWVPVHKHPQLNEQHSGMLTGQNKRRLAKEYGEAQVMAWRRRYNEKPPEIERENALQRAIQADERYDFLDGGVPTSESFAMLCDRLDTVWRDTIVPALRAGRTVMVVSHGNSLRALVKCIDGVSEEDVYYLDLPTATPLLYEFDGDLGHVRPPGWTSWRTWGDQPSAVRHGRFLVSMARVRAAQAAMRSQVSKNIAYKTFGAEVVTEAFAAQSAGRQLAQVEGEGYTVRQMPPAYFFQESRRLEEAAKEDLKEFRMATSECRISGQKKRVRCALVLLRHGQSAHNQDKIFTGWADPDLTNRGREEARLAGQLLKATGIKRIDGLYTSVLKRAVKTAWLALDEMDLQWTPIHNTWRLNERNYGALQGQVKGDCVEEYGLVQVQKWRRGYADQPPPWSDAALRASMDRRYAAALAQFDDFPPRSESLRECTERLMPFYLEELRPAMKAAVARARAASLAGFEYEVPYVVVVASENVLRGLVMHLEGLGEAEVPLVDVPYAVPLVYQMDSSLKPIPSPWAEAPLKAGWYLGDPAKIRAVQAEIQADLPEASDEGDSCFLPPSGEMPAGWKC